jgi:hypothetical protein
MPKMAAPKMGAMKTIKPFKMPTMGAMKPTSHPKMPKIGKLGKMY